MTPIKLDIEIKSISESQVSCLVRNEYCSNKVLYGINDGLISFDCVNEVEVNIKQNYFQFEKVIRSAIKGKIKVGQTINCVFIEGFPFLKDADFLGCIQVDRRNGKLVITTECRSVENMHKIVADGSYLNEKGTAGYAGFIEDPEGNQEIYSKSFTEGSSNLMELEAVVEGLKLLEDKNKIQINTDSRFVIRGLVQWVHFWRHNNWQTAFGKSVKFTEWWQIADTLCDGKLVQFRWVKGHSGNDEQEFCDELAKGMSSVD